MVDGVNNLSGPGNVAPTGASGARRARGGGGASFADVLKDSIGEVSRREQDATQAIEALATGRTDDVAGVMTAVEKADLAFKTLLAIRAKLMDAYEEIKSIQV